MNKISQLDMPLNWFTIFGFYILICYAPITIVSICYISYIKNEINCEQLLCFILFTLSIKMIEFFQTIIDKK